jgi:hypothetical protein
VRTPAETDRLRVGVPAPDPEAGEADPDGWCEADEEASGTPRGAVAKEEADVIE